MDWALAFGVHFNMDEALPTWIGFIWSIATKRDGSKGAF